MKKHNSLSMSFKKARATSGLSQKELGKKLGVSDKTISAYETGRAIPPTATLLKMAKITKTNISSLLGIETIDNRNEISKKLDKLAKKITSNGNKAAESKRIKIDVFVGIVLIDKNERIYLIKEEDKYGISLGRWNFPGGSVDDESLVEAAERETKEETGYRTKTTSLVGCYKCTKGDNSWMYVVFRNRLLGNNEEKIDPNVKEGKWFTKGEFLKLNPSNIVHPDMKLVYKIAIENRGLNVESVKYIDYDKE